MATLPTVGGDSGVWGTELNTWLTVGHNADGTHPETAPAATAPAVVLLTDAATITVNAALGNHFRVTLGGNRILGNPSGPADGQRIAVEVIQDATGGRTLSYGTAYNFGITGIPPLSTAAGARDLLRFVYSSSASAWLYAGTLPPAVPSGLATLDSTGLVPVAELPAGVANGVASLDGSGLVPVAQLPISAQSLMLAGSGAPASGLGLNGDTYEDTATGKLYAKAAGAWAVTGAPLALQATTGTAGFALQNATPTILTWTPPSDGAMHRFTVFGVARVATTEVGGAINYNFTDPGGTTASTVALAAAQAAGVATFTARTFTCQAGTAVSLVQQTALTSGAATVWAEIWGS